MDYIYNLPENIEHLNGTVPKYVQFPLLNMVSEDVSYQQGGRAWERLMGLCGH